MDDTSKGRGRRGLRVAPHCRGAASSMLRLSHGPSTTAFGSLARGPTVAVRLAQSVAVLPPMYAQPADAGGSRSRPLFTRLWPSVPFTHDAMWLDTLSTLD